MLKKKNCRKNVIKNMLIKENCQKYVIKRKLSKICYTRKLSKIYKKKIVKNML